MKSLLKICLFLLPITAVSQKLEETQLFMLNGKVYRGLHINNKDTSKIRIKTRIGNEKLINTGKIDSINRHQVEKTLYQTKEGNTHYQTRGYTLMANLGLLAGRDNSDKAKAALQGELIHSWVFNPHLSTGIGVSLRSFNSPFGERPRLPLFVNVRGNLFKNNFTPYATASYGKVMPWLLNSSSNIRDRSKSFESGRYYQFGLGIRNAFHPKLAYYLEAGYASGRLKQVQERNRIKREFQIDADRFFLKVGFQF